MKNSTDKSAICISRSKICNLKSQMVIGIIGCSRVGTSFANALSEKLTVEKVLLCRGSKKNSRFDVQGIDFLSSRLRFVTDISQLVSSSDIVFVAVKDDKIGDVVNRIVNSNVNINGKCFVHFSGVLNSDIFLPLKRKFDIRIASVHPVQSFPSLKLGMERVKNIYWVFEGDIEMFGILNKLIKSLKGKIVLMDKESKVYHHISCVFCSNFLVGLFYVVQKLINVLNRDREGLQLSFSHLRGSGLNLDIYMPLIKGVIGNMESLDPQDALTGPIIRGDVNTVKTHIKYLQNYPEFLHYYKQFSNILLEMGKDKLNKTKYMLIKKLIT